MAQQIAIPHGKAQEFCARWRIREMCLFGSVLRPDFGPDSDVDVLVTFEEGATWSLLDHVRMKRELGDLAGREVDLVTRRSVEMSANPLRRDSILNRAEPIYVAG